MIDDAWLPLAGFAGMALLLLAVARAPKPSIESSVAENSTLAPVAGQNWRTAGWLLAFVGVLGFGYAMLMKTSVPTDVPTGALGTQLTEIVNMGLLFDKGAAIAVSLAAMGMGIFCLAVGAIISAIVMTRRAD